MAKVLIVDDERELADEWRHALEKDGHEVVVWWSVSEVLDHLEEVPGIGVAVVDIMMPTLDVLEGRISEDELREMEYGRTAGPWICRKLKEKIPSPSIIIATVVEGPHILKVARDAGSDKILIKPFPNDLLVKAVREAAGVLDSDIDEQGRPGAS